ncbi:MULTISPECIES: hypothetical protein [Acinetobacter]|uniref:Lipoprotein n=1 Tax=Acinetobacter ursingii TaxID=108980 RepID=A0AA46P4F9_9GAMM|nr:MULTISPECIES: hypothetical protein [Acinetobacter]ENV74498.1 hypothetical protein F944_03349 [Acinetobacter ursingii DSM 16037 = CIP 107286]MCU4490205.1 hypothetical protein [Acinetobacter ursingii]MCU4497653.1 hypothetical protein [Acinetobacter ursingii]MCU4604106.1 hypothetical protein [Acinetobacter ursingii]MDG9860752.1 hypothetical protein [Acinetobacter ursingii]
MKVILISLVTALLAVGCVVLPEDHNHRHGDRYDYDRNDDGYNRKGHWDRDHGRWDHANGGWRYADRP